MYDLFENDVEYQDLRYYTDIVTERSVDFIQREHDRPWLMNLNYTTPHWPWEGRNDQTVSEELTRRRLNGEILAMFHSDGGSVEKYVEMVEDMGNAVGQVLNALRRSGQEKNTVVIFKSDNGGERYSYSWPLAGEKFEASEGGLRVPTIVRWPQRIKDRQVSHEPVMTPDWTRTLLSVAGTEPDAAYPMDGRDLSDYLWGDGTPAGHDLFWRVIDAGALRRGKWKYWYKNDRTGAVVQEKLFDLEADQREKADLSRKHPELVAELRAAWKDIADTLLPYPPGATPFGGW